MPYRNELGEFDLCAICKYKGNEEECEGCEIPMACLNNFEPDEHRVVILQDESMLPGSSPGKEQIWV